jgi:hypothetical protein
MATYNNEGTECAFGILSAPMGMIPCRTKLRTFEDVLSGLPRSDWAFLNTVSATGRGVRRVLVPVTPGTPSC